VNNEKPATYVLVDGENIDGVLYSSILGGVRPTPDQRPRWERVLEFVGSRFATPVRALFFFNVSRGAIPQSFVQALAAMHYVPVLLTQSEPGQKVVDLGILKTLKALEEREGHVVLVSHDGEFAPAVAALLDGRRRVAILGFRETTSIEYLALEAQGLEALDLETDAQAFTWRLPRIRIIPIDQFDPAQFL
jgi:putative heme uptake system protein